MRLPYLDTSLTVAVITRQTAGLDLLHALSNVFDDGRSAFPVALCPSSLSPGSKFPVTRTHRKGGFRYHRLGSRP